MEKNIKENASFYAMGIMAIIIAVLGITANTIYLHAGGYALGAGLVAVTFLFECFVFSISPRLAKTRTKGILFFTAIILTIYTILFIFGDLAKIKVYKSVYENGGFASKLQPLGVFALIFEVLSMILTVFFVARMILNLFGKEFKLYEKVLGTTVLRYKEREDVVLDLPEKDTDKLLASAQRALQHDDEKAKVIENAETTESDISRKTPLIRDADERKKERVEKKIEQKKIVDNAAVSTNRVEVNNKPEVELDNESDATELDLSNSETENEDFDNAKRFFENSLLDGVQNDTNVNKNVEITPQYAPIVNDATANEEVVATVQNNADEILNASIETVDENHISNGEGEVNAEDTGENFDITGVNELYADSNDVGRVLSEVETRGDIRNTGVTNRITEQVDSPDDDIYGLFDYDTDEE